MVVKQKALRFALLLFFLIIGTAHGTEPYTDPDRFISPNNPLFHGDAPWPVVVQANPDDRGWFSWRSHPRITGIRVGPHVPVGAPGYGSADDYCNMYILADEHTTVFAPGTLPEQKDYLFFVMTSTYLTMVSNSKSAGAQTSGLVVLSSPGPDKNGKWTLDFAPDYGYAPRVGDGIPSGDGLLCDTHGSVFRSPIVHNWCPYIPKGVPRTARSI